MRTDIRLASAPLGYVSLAFANCALFVIYIVLGPSDRAELAR